MSDASSTTGLPVIAAGDNGPVSSMSGGETDGSVGHAASSDAIEGNIRERKGDTKQRRKRTSPEDQLVLEAFYKENPKPNKAARAEILKDVKGMNEKEVQIWFQNRRQINRRKQRPLLPHEIAAFGLGGMAALSSDPITGAISSHRTELLPMGSSFERLSSQGSDGSSQELQSELQSSEERCDPHESTQSEIIPEDGKVQKAVSTPAVSQNVSKSFSSTPGYLANRWNTSSSSFSTPASSYLPSIATPSISFPGQPQSCPGRLGAPPSTPPSSQIRLSMSLDGKAEIVTLDLSPPRTMAPRSNSPGSSLSRRRIGLQRSQSALPFGPLSRKSTPETAFTPRLPAGRSRDTRTWEFCCDGDIRDELTTQAENESSGSALAAISLLRSASNSALKNNASKLNQAGVKQTAGKRLKLGRATSSLARLQSTGLEPSSKDKEGLMNSPSGDSDKENWSPSELGQHPRRRRPLPSGRQKQGASKRVLGDNFNVPTHAVNFGGATNKHKRRKSEHKDAGVFEDEGDKEAGEEVQRFMSGEISPSKKGDLDCVQGLLSLSQGNWR
ncbi:MBF complex negative regulatory component yox1 [Phlyctema vagabunda]|uniref:MBF complex negative regulatory component yox1 n=1 Tax=Phlyctema vagabunda TaxID=108571 RepID=A0ABR4PN96_9HELO